MAEPDENTIHLAAFVRRAGQWGLQLFGDELDKNNGNIKVALEKARIRFNAKPTPPPSPMLEALAVVNRVKMAEELGVELPDEESSTPKQEEQQPSKQTKKFSWSPKRSRVKSSPFERS